MDKDTESIRGKMIIEKGMIFIGYDIQKREKYT